MRRKSIISFAFLLLIATLAGCNNTTVQKDVEVLRFGYASNSPPVIEAMEEFGRLVSEKTDGQLTVEFFPDGQLGGERELIELTQTGAIDLTKVSGAALESFADQYAIFSIPYLFDSEEHFYNVMENKEVTEDIYHSTEEIGLIGLTYYDSGARNFYMNDGPVNKPEDLKGKKIRVMESDLAIKMIQLLGGSPTPIGSEEVYTSLQQGILDGAENNEFVLDTAGHGEVTKHYSYDEHTRVPDIVLINRDTLDNVSPEHRDAIYEAAEESTIRQKFLWHEAVENEKNIAIEEHGVEFNDVDKEPFKKAVQPIHEEFKYDEDYKALYNLIRDLSND